MRLASKVTDIAQILAAQRRFKNARRLGRENTPIRFVEKNQPVYEPKITEIGARQKHLSKIMVSLLLPKVEKKILLASRTPVGNPSQSVYSPGPLS